MDDLKKFLERFDTVWAVFLGVGSGVAAIWRLYRTHGRRWLRAMCLSDAVYSHFGPNAARELVSSIDRRKREGIIRESRQKLVEEELDLAVYVCSATGNCEWVNDRCANLLGISDSSCIGFGWLDGIEASERTSVFDIWMHAVKNRLPYECRYTVHNRRTGERRICITKAYPLISSDGKVWCYTGSIKPETPDA